MIQLIEKLLKNRLWTVGIFLALSIYGGFKLWSLPVDAVPDITNVQVMINTKTGALDPEKIEKSVTKPIETEMSGLPNVEEIRSLSKYGLSQVIIVFKEKTDLYFVRQLVSQRLQSLSAVLPPQIVPELAPVTTGLGEVLMYTLRVKEDTPRAQLSHKEKLLYLRTYQDFTLRPRLKKVPGVADIDTNGGFRQEIHINLFPNKLESFGLSIDELTRHLQSMGESFGGGYIHRDDRQLIVKSSSRMTSLEQIQNFPVKLGVAGQPVRLKDIADVRVDATQRVGGATSLGQETVLGTALMYVGANSREVARDLEKELSDIIHPEDIDLKIQYTRSFLVGQTLRTISKSLAEGAALVIFVLLLLLGHLRSAVVVALAIPVSMLMAAIGMSYFKISANLMSLGALDFGLLVDASVVIVENVLRRRGPHHTTLKARTQLVKESIAEVLGPVVTGLLIIMLVYVPILSLEGTEGKMFHPMALTVLMALGASLIVALFLIPCLTVFVLKEEASNTDSQHAHKDPWLFAKAQVIYDRALHFALKHSKMVQLSSIIAAVLIFASFFKLGSDFIPQLNEGDLVFGIVRSADISLAKSLEKQAAAEKVIQSFEEVETVFSRLGTPESATDPMGVNFADTFIILKKDKVAWPKVDIQGEKRRRTKDELSEALTEALKKSDETQEIAQTQPIEMRFNEMLEGSRADVSLRIYGPDLKVLLEGLNKAQEIVSKIKGVEEAETDALTALRESPVLSVVFDDNRLAPYGLSPFEANDALEMFMSGRQVGNFYEGDKRFPIVVHLDESLRDSERSIETLPLPLPTGGSVPLQRVATVREDQQVTTIARSFGQRYSALAIFLKDRDIQSFVEEARSRVEDELKLPPEYRVEWGGQFKNLEKARLRLMLIIPTVLILIFLILLKFFGSLRLTGLVYAAIPFAMTGGILALHLTHLSFSISASIGFIALLGIAILNGLVLVDFIHKSELSGMSTDEAVVYGAKQRLRPVLMTALVAALGFIPMALNTGLGAEVQKPLAVVVIGGIVSSTLLTLILLPLFYRWMNARSLSSKH